MTKSCRPCGRHLPPSVEFFSRCRGGAHGLDGQCKDCRRTYKQAYRDRNRERLAETERARYANDDGTIHRKQLEYEDAHRNERRAYKRGHYEKNKSKYIERARAYESGKQEVFDEHVDRTVVFERDEGICGICGKEVTVDNFHVDHVVPLSRGGRHNYGNVQVAHAHCNLAKHNRVPEEVVS